MKNISFDLANLFKKYGMDTKRILEENVNLDYLYALSEQRENVIEWFEFKPDASLLQVGAGYGALTGLYSRRVKEVCVLEEDSRNMEIVKMRYPEADNIIYMEESLEEHGKNHAEGYDYVMMIGSLAELYGTQDENQIKGQSAAEPETQLNGQSGVRPKDRIKSQSAAQPKDWIKDQIEIAKSLVKPGGCLILAVCNKFGMKYWAGCEREPVSVSRKELAALTGGEGTAQWYYPMPDYRIPITVYSQSYLPKKGDLTHTITAYDYPKYIRMDVGEKYDEVCEDGEFEQYANSFLVIWKKSV
ncbi:class I SAM-dependent methyltransferase [Clostridium sp. MCC353]|uniref:class I SAM-dependent methyltransferase n=1 Tax=Clostridium sp. MCC353 TaxID=2592646 RepID=UPI001C020BF3|nr:class I SAM-dependent methyltransferase [Clostridium sp. MCC353]MBT9778388.1 class I SAM-dependent methyltransferase [Clostridium sp. MCC353]